MSKRIKILTPRIYEHSDFFHNAYDFARKKSLNTNELCLELSRYLVEHFDKVWKIEKPRIYKQVCDLQSQLQQANEIINNPDTLIFQQQQLIDNLQSQLAENEKEISEYVKIVDDLHKQLSDKCDFCDKTKDQDKISFALEQLEKVKEEMDLRPRGVSKGWKNKEYDTLVEEDVYEVIDNQIKQLKEGK